MVHHWQQLLSQSEWVVSADSERLVGGSSAPSVQLSTIAGLMRVGKTSQLQDIPSDLFDLIIIEEDAIHNTRSVSSILQHFTEAAVIAFENRQPLDVKTLEEFGQPVFSHLLQERDLYGSAKGSSRFRSSQTG